MSLQDVIALLQTLRAEAQQIVINTDLALAAAQALLEGQPTERLLFNWPVGTEAERRALWPGRWVDATGYATRYELKTGLWQYHTGLDLNLNSPTFDSDAHAPVYACADGVVVFAGKGSGTWGNLVIIEHVLEDDTKVWSRCAHLESYTVKGPVAGISQIVKRGMEIAHIGNAGGLVPYHLHFDIAAGVDLSKLPNDWPGVDLGRVTRTYTNPKTFIQGRLG